MALLTVAPPGTAEPSAATDGSAQPCVRIVAPSIFDNDAQAPQRDGTRRNRASKPPH
jgi:hypothetical protein